MKPPSGKPGKVAPAVVAPKAGKSRPVASPPERQVLVLAGTRHGLFLFRSGNGRRTFERKSEALLGMDVADVAFDSRTGNVYAAAAGRAPGIYVSRDLGRTWTRRGSEIGAIGFTTLGVGHESAPKTIYAAATSALLHRSTDGGETWFPVWSLNEHPSRGEWLDHGCGLGIRSFIQDPRNPERMWAAVTGAGIFRSDDGGLSWQARNSGIPCHASSHAIFPDVGRCVHNLVRSVRGALWLSCHDGLYRSTNGGDTWNERSRALPTRFGQALAMHPTEDIALVVPESHQAQCTNGDFALWRGSNGGRDWQRAGRGLPERAHINVAPRALTTDALDPVGVYVGTSSGKLFASHDQGTTFTRFADDLPEIRSVHVTVLSN